jgi:hypothetical protein
MFDGPSIGMKVMLAVVLVYRMNLGGCDRVGRRCIMVLGGGEGGHSEAS